jgi:hypothetical protein
MSEKVTIKSVYNANSETTTTEPTPGQGGVEEVSTDDAQGESGRLSEDATFQEIEEAINKLSDNQDQNDKALNHIIEVIENSDLTNAEQTTLLIKVNLKRDENSNKNGEDITNELKDANLAKDTSAGSAEDAAIAISDTSGKTLAMVDEFGTKWYTLEDGTIHPEYSEEGKADAEKLKQEEENELSANSILEDEIKAEFEQGQIPEDVGYGEVFDLANEPTAEPTEPAVTNTEKKIQTAIDNISFIEDGQGLVKNNTWGTKIPNMSLAEASERGLAEVATKEELIKNIKDYFNVEDATVLEETKAEPTPVKPESKYSKSVQLATGEVERIETRDEDGNLIEVIAMKFDENGQPIYRDGHIKPDLDLIANPNLVEGTEVKYIVDETSEWWVTSDDYNNLARENHYKNVPIYVAMKDEDGEFKIIGKLAVKYGDETFEDQRRLIFNNHLEGKDTFGEVEQVTIETEKFGAVTSVNNLRNHKDENKKAIQEYTPHEIFRTAWVKKGDKFVLEANAPIQIFTTKGTTQFKSGPTSTPRLDLEGLDKNSQMAIDLSRSRVGEMRGHQDGHIWTTVVNPSGVYVPVKLSTSTLSEKAVDVVMEHIKNGRFNEAKEIIHADYENDQAGYYDNFIQLIETKSGEKYIKFRVGNVFYAIDHGPLAESFGKIATVREQELITDEAKGKMNLVEHKDKRTHEINVANKLRELLAKKKYNIVSKKLRSTGEYTSPVTGEIYKSYEDYLIGAPTVDGKQNREVETPKDGRPPSILTTDVKGSNGNFFYDTSMRLSIKNETVQSETKEDQTNQKTKGYTKQQSEDYFDELQNPYGDTGSADLEDFGDLPTGPAFSLRGTQIAGAAIQQTKEIREMIPEHILQKSQIIRGVIDKGSTQMLGGLVAEIKPNRTDLEVVSLFLYQKRFNKLSEEEQFKVDDWAKSYLANDFIDEKTFDELSESYEDKEALELMPELIKLSKKDRDEFIIDYFKGDLFEAAEEARRRGMITLPTKLPFASKTKSGKSLSSLKPAISESLWNSLSLEEQENILYCN